MNTYVYRSEAGRMLIEQAYRAHLASPLAEKTNQRFIETSFGKTFVIEQSTRDKPPLLLLHGSASNSASWLGVIPLFSEYFSVYCIDIPGETGLSSPNRFPLNSSAPHEWLAEVVDALNVQKTCMLGMSLGGWYAVDYAIRYPDRVAALSLLSSGGIAEQRTNFIFKALFFLMLGKRGQRMLSKAIYYRSDVPNEILEFQAVVSKHFHPVTERLPVFSDEQLVRLTMPVQYFGGDHDVLLDTKKSVERLRSVIAHAEVHVLENTGHAVIDKFEDVKDFLIRSIQP